MAEGRTIFHRSRSGQRGFRVSPADVPLVAPTAYARTVPADLVEVTEGDIIRHFTRLSTRNLAGDTTILSGRQNPRIAEEIVTLPDFAELHPAFPPEWTQGSLMVWWLMERVLAELAGLEEACIPATGAEEGFFAGLAVIRAFHASHGSARKIVLVAETASPAAVAACEAVGYRPLLLGAGESGRLSAAGVQDAIETHGRDLAALVLASPNRLGVFEGEAPALAEALRSLGAQIYLDASHGTPLFGHAKPRDLGADLVHFELHRTFACPSGGGGPEAVGLAVRQHLSPYLPGPRPRNADARLTLSVNPDSIGPVTSPTAAFVLALRSLVFAAQQGSTGLERMARTAVLNTNYLKARLRRLVPTGAKARGVVIEATESDSIQELDELTAKFEGQLRSENTAKAGENFDETTAKTIVGSLGPMDVDLRPVVTLDDRVR